MNSKELYLIYIHKLPENGHGEFTYDLFFSHNPINADGDGWGDKPLNHYATTPKPEFIDRAIEIRTKLDLVVPAVMENDFDEFLYNFSYYDITDGVMAMAYESEFNIDFETRIVLHFGDTYTEVFDLIKPRGYKPIVVQE